MVQNVGQLERRRRGETEYMPCTDKKKSNYLHSGKRREDSENVKISGLTV